MTDIEQNKLIVTNYSNGGDNVVAVTSIEKIELSEFRVDGKNNIHITLSSITEKQSDDLVSKITSTSMSFNINDFFVDLFRAELTSNVYSDGVLKLSFKALPTFAYRSSMGVNILQNNTASYDRNKH